MFQTAKYISDLVEKTLLQKPNINNFATIFNTIGIQQRPASVGDIRLPKNIDPNENYWIKVYPTSNDGKTLAATNGGAIMLYADSIIKNSKNAVRYIYNTIIHEMAHNVEEEGAEPDEDIESPQERAVTYLSHTGEINSHAWEYASLYSQEYPEQQFDLSKLPQLAQQHSGVPNIISYLVRFPDPQVQQKYGHIANLANIHKMLTTKMQQYVDYINQYNQKQKSGAVAPPVQ